MSNIDINKLLGDQGNAILQLNKEIDTEKNQIAIKDNVSVVNMKMTCGSKSLANFVPIKDATIVERLKASNFEITCKTNLDEFACGSTGATSAFGETKHPFLENCYPGGSSSGSAYVVAKGLVPISVGTDTGGSIRLPASLCEIYGLKPTYGLVPRTGVMSLATSLDCVGLFGQTSNDIAKTLNIISGHDSYDQTSCQVENFNALEKMDNLDTKNLKIGYLADWVNNPAVEKEVKETIEKKMAEFKKAGCIIEPVEILYEDHVAEMYPIIAYSEFSTNVARIDGIKYGEKIKVSSDQDYFTQCHNLFGDEILKRMTIGTWALYGSNRENYYQKAQKMRYLQTQSILKLFEKYDLLIGPVSPVTKIEKDKKLSPTQIALLDTYVIPFNMSGHPALSMPIGSLDAPVGLQVIGKYFDEATILAFAKIFSESRR